MILNSIKNSKNNDMCLDDLEKKVRNASWWEENCTAWSMSSTEFIHTYHAINKRQRGKSSSNIERRIIQLIELRKKVEARLMYRSVLWGWAQFLEKSVSRNPGRPRCLESNSAVIFTDEYFWKCFAGKKVLL